MHDPHWGLPLRGKWLQGGLALLVAAAPLAQPPSGEPADVGAYGLTCIIVWALVCAADALAYTWCRTAIRQAQLQRAARWLAWVATVAAFLIWIYPTEWREWSEAGGDFRQHRVTGQVQGAQRCECRWHDISNPYAASLSGVRKHNVLQPLAPRP